MAVTVAQFRLDFPAFADATAYPDTSIQFWLTLSTAFVGSNWGQYQDQGAELFTAHNLALGPSVGAGGSVVASGFANGPISAKSIKDVSVSYSTAIGTDEGAGFYNGTIYGRQYWQLRRLFGIGVIHLAGDPDVVYGWPGTSIYPLQGLA